MSRNNRFLQGLIISPLQVLPDVEDVAAFVRQFLERGAMGDRVLPPFQKDYRLGVESAFLAHLHCVAGLEQFNDEIAHRLALRAVAILLFELTPEKLFEIRTLQRLEFLAPLGSPIQPEDSPG